MLLNNMLLNKEKHKDKGDVQIAPQNLWFYVSKLLH